MTQIPFGYPFFIKLCGVALSDSVMQVQCQTGGAHNLISDNEPLQSKVNVYFKQDLSGKSVRKEFPVNTFQAFKTHADKVQAWKQRKTSKQTNKHVKSKMRQWQVTVAVPHLVRSR